MARDAQRQWFRFTPTAKADDDGGDGKATTLHIYDVIGADLFFGGVDVTELVTAIEGLDEDAELTVRINSPGGAAWDGLALANAIMRHPGKTITRIDGLAASAASLIALAGDEVVISRYGQMMLHNSRGGLYGTAEELKAAASQLEKLNGSMAEFYADRAGGEVAAWSRAMKRETWYNADEAKDAGLATSIDDSTKREEVEAAASAQIAKAAATFRYRGREAAPPPTAVVEDGPTGPDTKEAPVATSKEILKALGLPEDATDEQVLAKIAEGGDAGAGSGSGSGDAGDTGGDAGDKGGSSDTVDAGQVAAVQAAAQALGLSVIDPGTLAEMQRNSSLGAKAHATMETQRITAAVDAAIGLGKIAPARKEHFVALMRADEVGTVKLLGDIPPGTAVPMAELGHALDPVAMAGGEGGDVTESAAYKNWSVG